MLCHQSKKQDLYIRMKNKHFQVPASPLINKYLISRIFAKLTIIDMLFKSISNKSSFPNMLANFRCFITRRDETIILFQEE